MSDQPVPMSPGMHVQPAPFTANVGSGVLPDGSKFVTLHIEHATGSTMIPMPPEIARNLGENLLQQATGIVIAKQA